MELCVLQMVLVRLISVLKIPFFVEDEWFEWKF